MHSIKSTNPEIIAASPSVDRAASIAAWIFLGCFIVLLFGSYPVALLPPGLGGASYYLRLPSQVILCLTALPILVIYRVHWRRETAVCLGIFGAFLLFHALDSLPGVASSLSGWTGKMGIRLPTQASSPEDLQFFGAYLLVPVAVAVLMAQKKWSEQTVLLGISRVATALWLLNVVYGFLDQKSHEEVIGITGNRNWMAITLLALAPWAVWTLHRALRRFFGAWLVAVLVVAIPTLYLMYFCFSRAAWLAVVTYAVWFLFTKIPCIKRRLLYGLLLLVLLGAGGFLGRRVLYRVHLADVRIPTYLTTIRLICHWPLAGVGPGNFTRNVTPMLPGSGYHHRLVAAEVMHHPHNEILFIAACLGILPALAWAFLMARLVFRLPLPDPLSRLAHASMFVILFHSMLDKPFVQPPSDLIALFCIGLALRREWIEAPTLVLPRRLLPVFGVGVLFCVLAAGYFLRREFRYGLAFRHAVIAVAEQDYPRAVHEYARMSELEPRRIRGAYSAGAYAIERMMNPDLAMSYLARAYQLDPNYASINKLVGETLGTKGYPARALYFYRRHARLFPASTSAWQELYTALYLSRKYDELPGVARYLDALYREKVDLVRPLDQSKDLARNWIVAVRNSDGTRAIAMAQALTVRLSLQFPDFSLVPASGNLKWPPTFLWGKWSLADLPYWRSLVWRHDLLAQHHLLAAKPNPSLQRLVELVLQQVKVDPTAPPADPMTVWKRGCATPLDLVCMVAWIAEETMAPVIVGPDSAPKVAIATQNGLYAVALDARSSMLPIPRKGEKKMTTANSRPQIRVFLPPQAFLLKNQILATVLHHILKKEAPDFRVIPFLELRRRLTAVSGVTEPDPEALAPYLIQSAFQQFFRELKNRGKKSTP